MKSFAPVRFFQIAAFLTPLIAVLAPRALAIVLPLLALGAGISAWRSGTLALPPRGPTLAMIAVLLWGGASAAWAYEPRLVFSVWFQIASLAVAGLVVVQIGLRLDTGREAVAVALAYGMIAAVAILAIEWTSLRVFDHSLMAMAQKRHQVGSAMFNRGVATVAILAWPAALGASARWGRAAGAALVVAITAVTLQFDSMAAIAGLLAAALVFFLARRRPAPVAWALAALLAIGAAAAPVAPRLAVIDALIEQSRHSISIVHRLEIWRFVAKAIAERPVAGWGLNASRDLPGGIAEVSPGARKLPLHPHNAMLQWWLELGGVGVTLGTGLVILALLGASRLGADGPAAGPVRAAALASTTAAIVVAGVGYGIWQAWWLAALWLAAGFMVAIGGPRRPL
jgi:exopolysaccharide production protein ExoQ